MTDEQQRLNRIGAEVMGWELKRDGGYLLVYKEKEGRIEQPPTRSYFNKDGELAYEEHDWNPYHNLEQAWMCAEEVFKGGFDVKKIVGVNDDNQAVHYYRCRGWLDFSIVYKFGRADTPEKAIMLAVEKAVKGGGMIRARFKANQEDPRPINWPIKHPYWVTGYGPDYAIVVAYADDLEEVLKNWPEAEAIDYKVVSEYVFTDRFQKPDWLEKAVEKVVKGE